MPNAVMVMQSRSMWRVYLRQIAVFVFASGLGCALIYFIIKGPQLLGQKDISADAKTTVTANRVDNSKPVQKLTDFEKAIQSKKIHKLQAHYELLKNRRSGLAILQLDNFEKRIELLDAMIAVERNADIRQFVLLNKLDTYSDRERLAMERTIFVPAANDQLGNFATQIIKQFPAEADVAISLANISRFIAENQIDTRRRLRAQALEHFENVAQSNRQDISVANSLAEHVRSIILFAVETERIPFVKSYNNAYSELNEPEILAIIDEFKSALNIQDKAFPEIIETQPVLRDQKIQQLLLQAESQIANARQTIDSNTIDSLIGKIKDLCRIGRMDAASTIAQHLFEFLELDDDWTQQISQLQLMLASADSIFDASGLTSSDGVPVKFNRLKDTFKILLFVSQERRKSSIARMGSLQQSLSEIQEAHLFVAVYVERNGNKTAFESFQEFASQNKVNVARLQTNTPEGRKFYNQIPTDNIPFVLLLTEQNQIHALDPPAELLPEIIARHKSLLIEIDQ